MFLDSVPLSIKDSLQDENNIELKRMFEKYWFDERLISGSQFRGTSLETEGPFTEKISSVEVEKKHLEGIRKGRPKGSKNKPKSTN